MFTPSWRAWAIRVAGALLLTAPFAAFLALRHGSALEALRSSWPELLIVAALSGVGLLWAARAASRRYREALRGLAERLDAFRKAPGAAPLAADTPPEILAPITRPLESLAARDAKAIADLVSQNATLEALWAQPGRGEGERGTGKAVVIHRGSGSSRNMVARLTPNLHWMTATPALQQFLGRHSPDLNA